MFPVLPEVLVFFMLRTSSWRQSADRPVLAPFLLSQIKSLYFNKTIDYCHRRALISNKFVQYRRYRAIYGTVGTLRILGTYWWYRRYRTSTVL